MEPSCWLPLRLADGDVQVSCGGLLPRPVKRPLRFYSAAVLHGLF